MPLPHAILLADGRWDNLWGENRRNGGVVRVGTPRSRANVSTTRLLKRNRGPATSTSCPATHYVAERRRQDPPAIAIGEHGGKMLQILRTIDSETTILFQVILE